MKKTLLDLVFNRLGEKRDKLDKNLIYHAIECYIKHLQNCSANFLENEYLHAIEVASTLSQLGLDTATVATALLKDIAINNYQEFKNLESNLNKEVFFLLDNLHKIHSLESQGFDLQDSQNFCKLLLASSEDIRVLFIKLCCCLNKARNLEHHDNICHQRIAKEIMEIYAPLAERMGMNSINLELQDLAFNILHPKTRGDILEHLQITDYSNSSAIDEIVNEIETTLKKTDINATIYGRKKTPYSIWKKMMQKNVNFEQLSDIIACRIIVHTIHDCYQALNILHSTYEPIPNMFKDFISFPKNNGYQSLHTIVIDKNEKRIEVQIKTEYMHNIAEHGIAAHWLYKRQDYKFLWHPLDMTPLSKVISHHNDSITNIENTKIQLYKDRVFCFTPKKRLISLPKDATILDFAFTLHSELGARAIGAEVNNVVMPINTKLSNGDNVKILSSKEPCIIPVWLQYVVTSKAKSEISSYLKNKQRLQYIESGKSILIKLFKFLKIQNTPNLYSFLMQNLNKTSLDELFLTVGNKQNSVRYILNIIENVDNKTNNIKTAKDNNSNIAMPLLIDEQSNYGYNNYIFASCCYPLPDESIFGIISDKAVAVHRAECSILSNNSNKPQITRSLSWDYCLQSNNYTSSILVTLNNSKNNIEAFLAHLSMLKVRITNIKFISNQFENLELITDIKVTSLKELEKILKLLRMQENILTIKRYLK